MSFFGPKVSHLEQLGDGQNPATSRLFSALGVGASFLFAWRMPKLVTASAKL